MGREDSLKRLEPTGQIVGEQDIRANADAVESLRRRHLVAWHPQSPSPRVFRYPIHRSVVCERNRWRV